MGKTKIDLGISTEEKPEWTISLDYAANNMEKDELEEQSREQDKTKGSRSFFNDALDSDFLSDDRSSFSDIQISGRDNTSIAGGLNETIQSPGMGSSPGNEGSSDSILGAANGAILGEAANTMAAISTGAMEQSTEESSEIRNEIQEESPDRARDEVEETLNHLVNSLDPWEQPENALSEAAAMLSKEEKASTTGVDSDEKKLKDLFERLDISENLDRMNAVALEDMADVIEQTQKDNELVDAIDVGILESSDSVMKETEPELVLDLEPQKEETVSMGEMDITNDMFDLGYDLSDEEENYSDENIDLDLFKGSIEDTEEFSSTENILDLDVVEHTGEDGAGLDMSNLVEEAMSGLSGSCEEENLEIPASEEKSTLSDAEFIFEPEESESILEAAVVKPEMGTLDTAMPEESALQPPPVEFQTETPELKDEIVKEEAAKPEQIKLEFEPVYPEGQGPNLTGILNDTGNGDVASMIIEDYSEVPTVSDIETKLKKREKEKKKNKSRENQQKKTDGFAYSLDDINTKTADYMEHADAKMLVEKEAAEVAAETAAAGEASKSEESQSEGVTASVYARHVVHKKGKIKRTYYSLFYK
jgi:hypothetical protein